jgi:hypothetical protein|tara:strand:- start:15925 stop:16365 length:441 start_codon:yes stop_codon:yes gene_type:complete
MIDTIKNRNKTYHLITEGLPSKRQQIYNIILEEFPCSPQEVIEKYANIKYITRNVAMRFTELRESGYIVAHGTYKNDTGHCCTTYRPTSKDERINFINKKYQSLVDKKSALESDWVFGSLQLSGVTKDMIIKEINKIDILIKNLKS